MKNQLMEIKMKDKTYIIGSGWWCDTPASNVVSGSSNDTEVREDSVTGSERKILGDDEIRSESFHQLWYRGVDEFTNPKKIIIVDSNSPVIPSLNPNDQRLEFVSLAENSGHSTGCKTKFCGWTKSVLVGLQYALLSEVDYFIYIEQDALIYGEGIIEHCIDNMKKPCMFGSGEGTPQPLQQSFFIIDIKFASQFIERLQKIDFMDRDLSPENKFTLATSKYFNYNNFCAKRIKSDKKKKRFYSGIRNFDHLPFGYGRNRPVDFDQKYFYFQHGQKSEVQRWKEKMEWK